MAMSVRRCEQECVKMRVSEQQQQKKNQMKSNVEIYEINTSKKKKMQTKWNEIFSANGNKMKTINQMTDNKQRWNNSRYGNSEVACISQQT